MARYVGCALMCVFGGGGESGADTKEKGASKKANTILGDINRDIMLRLLEVIFLLYAPLVSLHQENCMGVTI